MPTIAERVAGLVAPTVAEAGLELYDVQHAGGQLRILVTRAGGVGVDELARLARAVGHLLDEADPIPGRYTLEVSSAGLERTLRTPAHFAGAVGSAVAVKTVARVEGERRFAGTLVAADEEAATVRLDDGTERTVAFGDIERAHTTFAWGPGPKPGSKKAEPRSEKAETR